MALDPQTEKARLLARLKEIEKAEKEEAERRQIIAGRVALAAMDEGGPLGDELRALLDRKVTKKRERALLGLDENSGPQTSEPGPSMGDGPGMG